MYLSKELAIKIRDHCLDKLQLKLKVPSINRMSLLPSGTGGGYYLEIGTCDTALPSAEREYLDKVLGKEGNGRLLTGPDELQAPGPLTVRIVTTGPMDFLAGGTWTGDEEPVRGGHMVAREGGRPGTLGCLVRLRRNGNVDNTCTFFLSCWHVLSGRGVSLGQYLQLPPAPDKANEFTKHLGDLYWSTLDEHFDAAIGLVVQDGAEIGEGFAWSRIGDCQHPGTPVDGQAVIVCGHESLRSGIVKEGIVKDTNTHLWLRIKGAPEGAPEHMFKDQIRTDSICVPGDSGAILFALPDSGGSPIPIGLAFYNTPSQGGDDKGSTYYNNLQTLFSTPFTSPTHENLCKDESFQLHEIIVGTESAH